MICIFPPEKPPCRHMFHQHEPQVPCNRRGQSEGFGVGCEAQELQEVLHG